MARVVGHAGYLTGLSEEATCCIEPRTLRWLEQHRLTLTDWHEILGTCSLETAGYL
jgi:hypothetical protein